MSFLAASFLAGLAAVAGPTVIHLLNRRRFRTVEWAAMRFLRDAVQRSRKILEIQDLLLLLLRSLAVLLFVLAMARPFFSRGTAALAGADDPVHAVVVLDNSLSMGFTRLDKSLLDQARLKAGEFVRSLPTGSRISVLPMVAAASHTGGGPFANTDDALDALASVTVRDAPANASETFDALARTLAQVPELTAKRVVLFTDLQALTWPAADLGKRLEGLTQIQVVNLAPADHDNSSVADLRLRDGVADALTPATFIATLRHDGQRPRERVRLTFTIDHAVAEERFVDLLPGQSLEAQFKYRFPVAGTSRDPLFAAVTVALDPDPLADDDARTLVVPVVARLPVLFIDPLGSRENPRLNRYGESFPLRRLLAPRTGDAQSSQLVTVVHKAPDETTRDDLREARLVVVAGLRSPAPELHTLLHQYVAQGGSLVVFAGGEFDPAAWNDAAWRSAAGILPAPLKPEFIGRLPAATAATTAAGSAADAPTFSINPASVRDPLITLPLPEELRDDLLASPIFFRAVDADPDAATPAIESLLRNAPPGSAPSAASAPATVNTPRPDDAAVTADATDASDTAWLAWAWPASEDHDDLPLDRRVARALPTVMASYTNGRPFALRRSIGRGESILVTTGIYPQWNDLATSHAVLILDQMLRRLIARTFPQRNFSTDSPVPPIPVDSADLAAVFTLQPPPPAPALPLSVEALGERTYGLILRDTTRRGVYTVRRGTDAAEPDADPAAAPRAGAWSRRYAIAGPAEESDLTALPPATFAERLSPLDVRVLEPADPLSLAGAKLLTHDLWRPLMIAALLCLLIELLFLGWTLRRNRRPGPARHALALPATTAAGTGRGTP